ncbi:MAG TPA: hypothetical protein GX513_03475 [Firmicutes bacterium]|nr:hypothetical protein [Bacillota bacterium]
MWPLGGPGRRPHQVRQAVTYSLVLAVVVLAFAAGLPAAREGLYGAGRWAGRQEQLLRFGGPAQVSEHFLLWCKPVSWGPGLRAGDGQSSTAATVDAVGYGQGVLAAAEDVYLRVAQDMGLTDAAVQRRIPEKIPLVLHSDQASMEKYVGSLGGIPTAGAYYRGVIHLAAGTWWTGALAHELTHAILDYTGGPRVPRWFSEGLAQWEEYRVTGEVLFPPPPAGEMPARVRAGDWRALEEQFPRLSDEVAYGVAWSVVRFLCTEEEAPPAPPGAVARAVAALAGGADFPDALQAGWGKPMTTLARDWATGQGAATQDWAQSWKGTGADDRERPLEVMVAWPRRYWWSKMSVLSQN